MVVHRTAQSTLNAPRGGAQEEFICHLAGTSDRRIGIYRPGGPQRCRVDYTRDGTTRSLCIGKALEIVRLLESVNLQCKPSTGAAAGSVPGP